MELEIKELITDFYTSKNHFKSVVNDKFDEVTNVLKEKGYQFNGDQYDHGYQIYFDAPDEKLHRVWDELYYIRNGIETNKWVNKITNEVERVRFNELREKVKEIVYRLDDSSSFSER